MRTPKIKSILESSAFKIALITALLLVVMLPLAANIKFYQNDDYIYYKTIQKFQNGEFGIPSYIETTFYTQGILGLAFAALFGISSLPILTLIFSVLNFSIFTHLLNRFYTHKLSTAVLLGLILFFNPLHIYSSLGFMTDNYLLFFMLLTFLGIILKLLLL